MNSAYISIWPQFKLQVHLTFYLAHLEISHCIVSVKDAKSLGGEGASTWSCVGGLRVGSLGGTQLSI